MASPGRLGHVLRVPRRRRRWPVRFGVAPVPTGGSRRPPGPAVTMDSVKARLHRGPRVLRSPANVVLLVLLAAVSWFYLWTASSSGNPIRLNDSATDYYNLLSDAFAAGQL